MSRSRVRWLVLLTVFSQTVPLVLFLSGEVREPYPLVVLPSFDQSLCQHDGTCEFVVPAVYVEEENGIEHRLTPNQLRQPGVPSVFFWWLLPALAPPPSPTRRPSLPSFGAKFSSNGASPSGLSWLFETAERAVSKKIMSVRIQWEVRRYVLVRGRFRLAEVELLGGPKWKVQRG